MTQTLDHPRFLPTSVEIIPLLPADMLGDAVLHALSRPPAGWLYFGTFKVAILGALTFGLYPIFALPKRFRGHIALERHQLQTLTDWLAPQLSADESQVLTAAAKNVRGSWVLKKLMQLTSFGAIAVLLFTMFLVDVPSMPYRFSWTYPRLDGAMIDDARVFAFGYAGLLAAAYLTLMWQVNIHSASVEKWLLAFDAVGKRHGMTETPAPGIQFGLTPTPIVLGVGMAIGGAYWALPMMLACNAARRYIKHSGRRYRATLSHRVRMLMLEARPGEAVPLPVGLQRLCHRENCQALSPAEAKFCARCGGSFKK